MRDSAGGKTKVRSMRMYWHQLGLIRVWNSLHVFLQASKVVDDLNPDSYYGEKIGLERPATVSLVGMDGSEADAPVDGDFEKLVEQVYRQMPQPPAAETILKVKFDDKYVHEMDGMSFFVSRQSSVKLNNRFSSAFTSPAE